MSRAEQFAIALVLPAIIRLCAKIAWFIMSLALRGMILTIALSPARNLKVTSDFPARPRDP
jgi:hypothetical protein